MSMSDDLPDRESFLRLVSKPNYLRDLLVANVLTQREGADTFQCRTLSHRAGANNHKEASVLGRPKVELNCRRTPNREEGTP